MYSKEKMMRKLQWMTMSGGLLMALTIGVGCNLNASGPAAPLAKSGDEHADHAGHAHPSEGPHGGELIELGNEKYHAELVHPREHDDDAHPKKAKDDEGADHDHAGLTVHILDGSAKELVLIDAKELTINLKHDGKAEQFKLSAMPSDNDPDGMSSRFASDDKELLEHFYEEEINGTLVVTISGKQFRGTIEHNHDHDHAHAKHDHAETEPK